MPLFLFADDYRTGPEPSWIDSVEIPRYEPDADEVANGEYYLLSDIQVNRETSEYYNRYALLLSNSTGLENNSQISIDFDPAYEDLTVHKIRVIRNGEILDRLEGAITSVIQQEKELESLLYNGTMSFYAILSDIRIGDIVEVSFSVREKAPLFSGLNDRYYVEWGVPVRKVIRRIISESGKPLHYRTNSETAPPDIRNGNEYIWSFIDAAPVEYEDNVPYWFDAHNFIEVTQYENWDQVRREIMDFYAPIGLNNEQASYILSNYREINDDSDPEDIAKILLNAVQEDIRYMGIEIGRGSYIPTEPSDVFNRRFGDCKDKTLLFTSLLNHLGIDAWPVLVHNSEGANLTEALPGPYQFNHVIAKVKIGEDVYWLDPTYTYQEGNLDQISLPYYSYGLVLSPHSHGLEVIAPGFTGNNMTVNEYFTLPADVEAAGDYIIETVYLDEDADYMRSWLANSPRSDIADELHSYMRDFYAGIEIIQDFDLKDILEENKIILTEYYSIQGIWEYSGDDDKYQFTYSPYEIYNYTFEPEENERYMPYHLRHPFNIIQNAYIKLPDEWNVEEIDDLFETEHFRYSQKTAYEGNEISLTYSYQSKSNSVPPSDYYDYRDRMKEISSAIDYIVFRNPMAEGESENSRSGNYGSLAVSLLLGAYLIFRIARRSRKSLDQIH